MIARRKAESFISLILFFFSLFFPLSLIFFFVVFGSNWNDRKSVHVSLVALDSLDCFKMPWSLGNLSSGVLWLLYVNASSG